MRAGIENPPRGCGAYQSPDANQFFRAAEPSRPRTGASETASRRSRGTESNAPSSSALRSFADRVLRTAIAVSAMSRKALEEFAAAGFGAETASRAIRDAIRIIPDRIAAGASAAMGPASHGRGVIRPVPRWVLWAFVLSLAAGCSNSAPAPEPGREPVPSAPTGVASFRTADGVDLKASWTPSDGPVFVVMHGLGAGRGEWDAFTRAAAKRGWGVFAFDARGHGESGGPSYETFRTAEAWAAILGDFDAALAWLKERGVPEGRVVLGGASVGSNLALHAALRHPGVGRVLLLSPGWVYAGIPLYPAIAELKRPVVIAAAPPDAYAYQSAGRAIVLLPEPKPVFLEGKEGHGVGMFNGAGGPEFLERVLDAFGG